jgi:hypothetical protein
LPKTFYNHADEAGQVRRQQLEIELSNLSQNLLAGLVSLILMGMISHREAELARLPARAFGMGRKPADTLPDPVRIRFCCIASARRWPRYGHR